MQTINLKTWKRANHFEFYKNMDYPHFNICADVSLTQIYRAAKENRISLFQIILYAVSRAANTVEELRYRIRDEAVVIHPAIHPSFTVLAQDNLYGFGYVDYNEDIKVFVRSVEKETERSKDTPSLSDESGRDDYIFISTLPWIRFTGLSHPIHMHPADSIPRITWGKYENRGDEVVMPLSVQVHHGLADGYHIGRFYSEFQALVDDTDSLLEPLYGFASKSG